MNVVELFVVIALFAISVALGKYFHKFVGWLAFVPAGFFGLVILAVLLFTARTRCAIFQENESQRMGPVRNLDGTHFPAMPPPTVRRTRTVLRWDPLRS
jgi:hypothetical protein